MSVGKEGLKCYLVHTFSPNSPSIQAMQSGHLDSLQATQNYPIKCPGTKAMYKLGSHVYSMYTRRVGHMKRKPTKNNTGEMESSLCVHTSDFR